MLTTEQRRDILRFDTCKIANAIESLNIRLRNEGFTHPGIRSVAGGFPVVLGYAVTSIVRCADPPMKGYREYHLEDWWENIALHPKPRIAFIQDIDDPPGQGAILSDVHAHVLRALDCQAIVTNGAVRNVPALTSLNFPAFSAHIAMSHAYAHMVEFDVPVQILGLTINPGDLMYADIHGAVQIPEDRVADITRQAAETAARQQTVIDLCRSPEFSLQALRALNAARRSTKEVK